MKTTTLTPVRSQADTLGDDISLQTGYDTGSESLTRQEFKDEADLNILLGRFGVNQQVRQDPRFMEVDYDLDLQTAIAAVESARRANYNVPEELRTKYPDWRAVLDGAESGQYQKDLQELADRKKTQAKLEEEEAATRRKYEEWKQREALRAPEETPKP